MRLSKTISALFLSFVILFASLTQANAKRLHAAIAEQFTNWYFLF